MAKDGKGLQAWYFLARYVTSVLFKILFRFQVIGKEKVPQTGKLLVCANHSTMADPIFLGSAIPGRQMKFVAKAELFKNKIIGNFLSSLGAFPISRGTGGAEGIQTAMRYLEEGRAVCMFPEGTRSKTGELLQPKNGAAMLADMIINECSNLNIWMGQAVNPAHQDAEFLRNFNYKESQAKELKEIVEKMGKEVKFSYT